MNWKRSISAAVVKKYVKEEFISHEYLMRSRESWFLGKSKEPYIRPLRNLYGYFFLFPENKTKEIFQSFRCR